MSPSARASAGDLLSSLRSIRHLYAPEHAAQKLAALRALSAARLATLDHVTRWHEDLLFLRAYPDNADVRAAAVDGLARVERAFRRLGARQRAAADDTGIAGSASRHVFGWPIARWLAVTHASDVEVDWHAMTDTSSIERLMRFVLQRSEEDAFDDERWGTREWMEMARGSRFASALQWLVSRGASSRTVGAAFGGMYDAAELQVKWSLAESPASVTRNALADTPLAFRSAMRPAPTRPARHVAAPMRTITLLDSSLAGDVIEVARAALASRCREVDAISWGNPDEVWLADLGEGTALAIIGLPPERRLSLESNYGYVLLSNGVPVGYGGVTPLFQQANTGINIFDPFRHGEAAFAWAQMLRAFHSLFGVRRFVVNAYQFGEANDEAINSGAFWFYYRLGFRPVSAGVRRLAASEQARRESRRGYRSPARTLVQLASGDLHLTLPGFAPTDFFDERWLPVVSANAARLIAAEDAESSDEAASRIARRVASALDVKLATWDPAERAAFVRLSPVVAQLPVGRWPARDRRRLVDLLRKKGEPQERDFVRAAQAHPRFYRELIAAARKVRHPR